MGVKDLDSSSSTILPYAVGCEPLVPIAWHCSWNSLWGYAQKCKAERTQASKHNIDVCANRTSRFFGKLLVKPLSNNNLCKDTKENTSNMHLILQECLKVSSDSGSVEFRRRMQYMATKHEKII